MAAKNGRTTFATKNPTPSRDKGILDISIVKLARNFD